MNQHAISLTQTIQGFLLSAAAEQLSSHTIADYQVTLRRFEAFVGGETPMDGIKRSQVEAFLASLAQPQEVPGAVTRRLRGLSKKTILNYHTGLSALWTWAVREGVASEHVLHSVNRPRPEVTAIVPFTKADIEALLNACERSQPYDRPGKRTSDHSRPTKLRDRAMILLLLDTGLRASELADLVAKDVDVKNRRVWVFGKGSKERMLPMSAETAKALWRYLAERADEPRSAPLFTLNDGRPMTRIALLQLLGRLGEKAGVKDCHPHRFRHTFAIQFLRNKGGVFQLQMMLGHSTLEMCRKYLAIAEADVAEAHQDASPVARWRLR
jgi:integrase/recombinase XerD